MKLMIYKISRILRDKAYFSIEIRVMQWKLLTLTKKLEMLKKSNYSQLIYTYNYTILKWHDGGCSLIIKSEFSCIV